MTHNRSLSGLSLQHALATKGKQGIMAPLVTPSSCRSTRMHDKLFYYCDGSVVLSALGDSKDVEHALAVVDNVNDGLPVLSTSDTLEKDPLAIDTSEKSAEKDIVIYFRIHKSLLMEESAVFKDMFVVGSLSTEHELYDGVPLIALYDKARDVRWFLRAIYKPLTVFLPRYSFRSATLLRSPLLLAVKYQADSMKDSIISHLRNDWPGDDYNTWRKRGTSIPERDPAPEALIRLARTTGCTEELWKSIAVAYYTLLSLSPSCWSPDLLEPDDFMSLIKGRTQINILFLKWVSGVDSDPEGQGPLLQLSCQRLCRVGVFKEWLLAEWSKCSLESMDVVKYLESVARKIETTDVNNTLCTSACRGVALKWVVAMARAFYERLEDIFSIANMGTVPAGELDAA